MKGLNDYCSRFILKQLDYWLSISMCDSWRPRQLSRDRNLELII